jgi:hypothetical protein
VGFAYGRFSGYLLRSGINHICGHTNVFTNNLERDLEEVRRRIKIQGYFKSDRTAELWVYGIISQFRQEPQPEVMPKHIVTIFNEPKYESVQLS